MTTKRKPRPPSYRLHKATGQAIVTLNGRDHYLGSYGAEASHDKYDRLIAEWLANGRILVTTRDERATTVDEVMAAYLRYADGYYRKRGRQTPELHKIKSIMRVLRPRWGRMPANDFGPLALKAAQTIMIEQDLSRRYINEQIARIKRMFKWATANELVSAPVFHALQTVDGLRRMRSRARETEPVRPVPDEHVNAIQPHVSRQVWAVIELQRLTGMRSGEVVIMRPCDIGMTGNVWLYRQESHKTQHHGHDRIVELGPGAQRVVGEFLRDRATDAYLFSPAEAETERRTEMRRWRKSAVQPLQLDRRKRNPKRKPQDRYNTASYRRAINRACDLAFPPPANIEGEALKDWRKDHCWHPHQLRHTFATRVRKDYGIESARILCGHRSLAVTETYAEIDRTKVQGIMSKIG